MFPTLTQTQTDTDTDMQTVWTVIGCPCVCLSRTFTRISTNSDISAHAPSMCTSAYDEPQACSNYIYVYICKHSTKEKENPFKLVTPAFSRCPSRPTLGRQLEKKCLDAIVQNISRFCSLENSLSNISECLHGWSVEHRSDRSDSQSA